MKIDKAQLNILKSYINPPLLVVQVLQAACLIFGHGETWESAKRYLLGDFKFLEKMVEFDVSGCLDIKFINLRNNYISIENFKKEFVFK